MVIGSGAGRAGTNRTSGSGPLATRVQPNSSLTAPTRPCRHAGPRRQACSLWALFEQAQHGICATRPLGEWYSLHSPPRPGSNHARNVPACRSPGPTARRRHPARCQSALLNRTQRGPTVTDSGAMPRSRQRCNVRGWTRKAAAASARVSNSGACDVMPSIVPSIPPELLARLPVPPSAAGKVHKPGNERAQHEITCARVFTRNETGNRLPGLYDGKLRAARGFSTDSGARRAVRQPQAGQIAPVWQSCIRRRGQCHCSRSG